MLRRDSDDAASQKALLHEGRDLWIASVNSEWRFILELGGRMFDGVGAERVLEQREFEANHKQVCQLASNA
jgi:hypothetical protein